jgi:hypothetical protein
MDGLARDGDSETAGAQPFTLVFSAGNAGDGESTLTSPKEAKNIITVASSDSHRIRYELGSTEESTIDRVSTFSSRGPALDGRVAPTVAAPGQAVMSTRSNENPTFTDCTLPVETAVAQPEPQGFPHHAYCSGTSMASPHVAGAVALITQWWRRDHAGADPSPAMSKALLVNSATDMGDRDVPNGDEGWGRVNVGALLTPGVPRITTDQEHVLTDPGSCFGVSFAVADPSKPVRATLTWTDAPGAPDADPALVNDLDLVLTGAEGAFHGNRFSDGRSVIGVERDKLNNVENVWIDQPATTYELTVDATNLPGDGVPYGGDATDQDFALVVTNATLLPVVPARCAPPAPAAAPAPKPARKKKISARVRRARYRRCVKRARKIRSARKRARAVKRCRVHLRRR